MSVRSVLAGGFGLLLVALALVLLQSEPRSASSNYVPELSEVAKLQGPAQRCQEGETVPADTGGVRFLIGTYGRAAPTMSMLVRRPDGTIVTRGRVAGGGPEGDVDMPLRDVDRVQAGVTVCLTVRGRGRTVLYGSGGRMHLEWMRPGSETWLGLAPTIAHRFSLGRWNPLGTLLLPALALLLLGAWVAAACLVLREARP